MIITKDSNPENDIYFLGSILIEVLDSIQGDKIDFLDAYQKMNDQKRISVNLFSLVVDWLFLIGSVKSEKSYIIKCF